MFWCGLITHNRLKWGFLLFLLSKELWKAWILVFLISCSDLPSAMWLPPLRLLMTYIVLAWMLMSIDHSIQQWVPQMLMNAHHSTQQDTNWLFWVITKVDLYVLGNWPIKHCHQERHRWVPQLATSVHPSTCWSPSCLGYCGAVWWWPLSHDGWFLGYALWWIG